jgi:hypothetical protein
LVENKDVPERGVPPVRISTRIIAPWILCDEVFSLYIDSMKKQLFFCDGKLYAKAE